MKILFCLLSVFLLSSCSQLSLAWMSDKRDMHPPLKGGCAYYPYDKSETLCNFLGWQTFYYQSLSHTKKEHDAALRALRALRALGTDIEGGYKQAILLSYHFEPLNIRIRATDDLFDIADENENSFGDFFYLLATSQKNDLLNQLAMMEQQVKLKKIMKKNSKLKADLANTEAKIQAIMEIEKNLKTD